MNSELMESPGGMLAACLPCGLLVPLVSLTCGHNLVHLPAHCGEEEAYVWGGGELIEE